MPWTRYEVGGAVRDALLGQPVQDRDWVVVGATPEALVQAGYLPVGRDFPVFLHPETREEHALARTERKTAPGYHGFVFHAAPDVTLEEDLARRDLTINAIARAEDGRLIDPCGGLRDLADRVLRHVSPAFAEDPVRILRIARFAARWPDFHIAPETAALMRRMVDAGEVDALVAERVWQEFARGLMEAAPGRMLDTLAGCGALPRLLPPDCRTAAVEGLAALAAALDRAGGLALPLPVRFALCADAWTRAALPAGERPARVDALCGHWRVPAEAHDRATLVAREGDALRALAWPDPSGAAGPPATLDPETCLQHLERWDAWRRPERVEALLSALTAIDGLDAHHPPAAFTALRRAREAGSSVDTAAAAARAQAGGARGPAIGAAVRQARRAAIEDVLRRSG